MSKIRKVVFIQDEVETKSNFTTVEFTPVVVGKVDLENLYVDPNHKVKPEKDISEPVKYDTFDVSDWSFYMDFIRSANKALGKVCITLSKTAYIKGVKDPNFGTIWYNCGSKYFKELFRIPVAKALSLFGLDLRPLSKTGIKSCGINTEIFILWLNIYNMETEIVSVKKCDLLSNGNFIYYVCGKTGLYKIPYTDISDSGTGVIGDENFYFYVSNKVENL